MNARGCIAAVGLALIALLLVLAMTVISGIDAIDTAGAATPYKQYLPEVIITYPTPPPR
jgi:hypothetical protein